MTTAVGAHVASVPTSRPRHGRRFEPTHELALLSTAVRSCGALPAAHRGLTVVSEMSGPFGIPDLTAVVGPNPLLAARLAVQIDPLLHQVDAAVVSAAHHRVARTPSRLAGLLGWPEETVARRLGHLIRSGALVQIRPDRYCRHQALQPLGRLYAVEAKVRDWRQALRQVRAYTTWADAYVLVMGRLAPAPASLLAAEVELDHGGLMIDGRWVRRPSVRRLSPAQRLWASEHVVAALK